MANDTKKVITYTTAPASFDWWFTKELEEVGTASNGKTVRKVESEADKVEQQRGRYHSGAIYVVVDEVEFHKLVKYGLVTLTGDVCAYDYEDGLGACEAPEGARRHRQGSTGHPFVSSKKSTN